MIVYTLARSKFVRQASEREEEKERQRKIYRYTLSLTNPFPRSGRSYVTWHHGVDNHFQFLNPLERYQRRRNEFIAKQAIEMARWWIIFSNGKEPWGEYIPPTQGGQGKITVCDDIRGLDGENKRGGFSDIILRHFGCHSVAPEPESRKGHAISPLSQSRLISLRRRKTRSESVVVIAGEDIALECSLHRPISPVENGKDVP